MGLETFTRIWGRKGQDYRKAHASMAKSLGMTPEQYQEKVLYPNLLDKLRLNEDANPDGSPLAQNEPQPADKKEPVTVER